MGKSQITLPMPFSSNRQPAELVVPAVRPFDYSSPWFAPMARQQRFASASNVRDNPSPQDCRFELLRIIPRVQAQARRTELRAVLASHGSVDGLKS